MSGKKKRDANAPEGAKKTKKALAHLGVVEVEGAGVKVFLDRDIIYGYNQSGIVNGYLRCRDQQSTFYNKFFGYKHSELITVGSMSYGLFSYQYRGQHTAQELATVFQAQPLMLYKADAGTVSSNIKVEVKHYVGLRSTDFLYSDADILDYYDDDS